MKRFIRAFIFLGLKEKKRGGEGINNRNRETCNKGK
jgi:hypothetical protein